MPRGRFVKQEEFGPGLQAIWPAPLFAGCRRKASPLRPPARRRASASAPVIFSAAARSRAGLRQPPGESAGRPARVALAVTESDRTRPVVLRSLVKQRRRRRRWPGGERQNELACRPVRLTPRRAISAKEAEEQFTGAGALQSANADAFLRRGLRVKFDRQTAGRRKPPWKDAEIFKAQSLQARMPRAARELFAQIAPDHPLNQFGRGQFGGGGGADPAAIAQHGDAVGDALDFLHLVRDVNDAAAALLERLDQGEKPFRPPARSGRWSVRP